MFDHISITVKDFTKSKTFYDKALSSLGLKALYGDEKTYCGFGSDRPFFWIGASDSSHSISSPVHIAFAGTNKEVVGAFYKTAMEAGAKDNGAPGYHTEYSDDYYAAFVLDPDGNNIEVVCRS
jgi:catechol 2,3-dioxygenase-like lactoylglutathione lyase family enzyme